MACSVLAGLLSTMASAATPRPSTTTTTVPTQSMVKPLAHDHALDIRMRQFYTGLRDNNNALCDKAFLPMMDYVALKQGGGNQADWRNRLMYHFHLQLAQLRKRFAASLPGSTYNGYRIPYSTAHTVRVGAEENKAPYWQVFMTTMAFHDKNGRGHNFTINTLISFRGEWWIVHVIGYG